MHKQSLSCWAPGKGVTAAFRAGETCSNRRATFRDQAQGKRNATHSIAPPGGDKNIHNTMRVQGWVFSWNDKRVSEKNSHFSSRNPQNYTSPVAHAEHIQAEQLTGVLGLRASWVGMRAFAPSGSDNANRHNTDQWLLRFCRARVKFLCATFPIYFGKFCAAPVEICLEICTILLDIYCNCIWT